jgi:hypothetical protein
LECFERCVVRVWILVTRMDMEVWRDDLSWGPLASALDRMGSYVPLRERIAADDICLQRDDVALELVKALAGLLQSLEVVWAQRSLCHGGECVGMVPEFGRGDGNREVYSFVRVCGKLSSIAVLCVYLRIRISYRFVVLATLTLRGFQGFRAIRIARNLAAGA